MSASPVRIIQISDIHLFSDPTHDLLGVKTEESFNTLIEFIKLEKPDLILLTGDLSQDGSKSSYLRVADALNQFAVNVYCLPGNHDDAQIMRETFPRGKVSMQRHIVLKNWQLILLNSHKPKAVEGYLESSELEFLEQTLTVSPNLHTIVALHHQPVTVGSTWLDKIGLTNANAFWEILQKYDCVNTVLFGHIHQLYEGEKYGIPLFSSPSTCIQFKTNSSQFALEKLPPGYRWLELYPNGELKTKVERVAEYVGVFQENAKGY